MRLACSTASFPEDRLEIAIAKCAWAGFRGVELPLTGELPSVEAVRGRLRADGLELSAVHAGTLPGGGPEALAEQGRIGRAAAFARALDGALLVVEAAGTPAEIAASLRLLDRALGEVAVDLCVVNGTETALASRDALAALWAEGLPERVGLALDPARALLAGWDPLDLEALPELPRHVYLTDADGTCAVPPGEGKLDLPRLGAELRYRGYGGSLVLRLENADPWAVEPLTREIREAAEEWF